MNWNEFLINLIGGVIGGGIVAAILQYYLNHREKKKDVTMRDEEERKEISSKIVKSKTREKIITNSIFWDLKPGASIEQMHEMLGTPTIRKMFDETIFTNKEIETNSYLYMVNNAYIKITSKDDKTIDTLTIFPFGTDFHFDSLSYICDQSEDRFNVMIVCEDLIEQAQQHMLINNRMDSSFALKTYYPNPLYQYFTFYGHSQNNTKYLENKDPNIFLGGVIQGVCISNSSEQAYFIYDYELR